MAAIGKIRKQSGLLIVLIGMAMLLFLMGDIFSSGSSVFTQQEQIIGTIAGEEISMQDYELRVQDAIDAQFGMEGASEQAKQSIRERIWQQMIRERVMETELTKLGINVTADEILDQVRNTKPGSVLYQYFTDPQTGQIIEQFRNPQTGGLDGDRVLQAIQNLLNSENSRDWLPIEQAIKQETATDKYTTMLSKGITVTGVEARQMSRERAAQSTFSYAVQEFSALTGEEYEPKEADFEAYFEKHKDEQQFKVEEETRALKLAIFEVMPTPEDIEEIRLELAELVPEFKNDSNDSAFVAENAEGQLRNLITYSSAEDLHPSIKDSLPSAPMGTVFGPTNAGGSFNIYKKIGVRSQPDSVRASHILISVNDGDTAKISAAREKLDSLRTVAKANNNFAALATEFSEDFGSAEKGGDLDWFPRGRMVAPFEKAAFNSAVGDMPIIESQFGVHLIYITDQTKPKPQYLVARVDRLIEPSKETSDAIYNKASRFSIDHQDISSFDAPSGEYEAMIEQVDNLRIADEMVGPVNNAREMVRWAFEAEVGDVSAPFETDQFFTVAAVMQVTEEGTMDLESAKGLIFADVANQVKADAMIAKLGDYKTLQEASNKLGVDVKTANSVNFAQGSLPGGLGREMKVLGAAFGLAEGQVSRPIQGNRGVYVVEVKSRTNPDAASDLADIKRNESATMSTRVGSQVYNALQKNAGVKDQRAKYY